MQSFSAIRGQAWAALLAFLGVGARRRRLAALRSAWGRPVARERYLFSIAAYHDLLARPEETVDQTTWRDLAMDDVFAELDRTCGMPGRQMLYHQLRTYQEDERLLAERARQYAALRADPGLREAAQLLLGALEGPDATWLAPLLLNQLPERPAWAGLLYLSSLLTLTCLAGLYFQAWFLLPVLLLIAINIALNETYGRKITAFLAGFSQIEKLFAVGAGLAALPDPHRLPQLRRLRELAPTLVRLRKKLSLLVFDRSRVGDIGKSFIGYLNMCLLMDILAFVRAITSLQRHQQEMMDLLEAVASLDAAIAVASFLDGLPFACVPEIAAGRQLRVRNLYHPLLPAAVGNPLALADESALITGSNMTGKTTFMRTVGVNLLLARTLNLCCAESACLPRARVQTSIRREDSQAEGKSYYMAELERIQSFFQAAEDGQLRLFLLDELFRGTNTLERLASATAVLRHLGRGHLVLATTHDLELQGLLDGEYRVFHFGEQVTDGRVSFDYRIQPGPTRTRNAIRLLESVGFPAAVTVEARALADRIAAGGLEAAVLQP